MKIGIFIGGAGSAGTLQDQIAQVVEAERAGFDSLWAAHIMDVDVMYQSHRYKLQAYVLSMW